MKRNNFFLFVQRQGFGLGSFIYKASSKLSAGGLGIVDTNDDARASADSIGLASV